VSADLVRNGGIVRKKGIGVYLEMIYQVCRDYASLPDIRTLTSQEIRFWYSGLIPELKEATTKPKKSK